MKPTTIFLAIAAVLLTYVPTDARADECLVDGQVIIKMRSDNRRAEVLSCYGTATGISLTDGFTMATLRDFLDQNRNDPAVIAGFQAIGIGDTYEAQRQAILGVTRAIPFIEAGEGERVSAASLARLNALAAKMNEWRGVDALIAQRRAEDAAQSTPALAAEDRRVVPVTFASLEAMATNNTTARRAVLDGECGGSDAFRSLQAVRVNFADGEHGLMMPFAVRRINDTDIEVQMQASGTGLGGLSVGPGMMTRRLRFVGGQILWVGARDGVEYPVTSFTDYNAERALGGVLPFGTGRNFSCVYANHFRGSGGSNAGSSGGVNPM